MFSTLDIKITRLFAIIAIRIIFDRLKIFFDFLKFVVIIVDIDDINKYIEIKKLRNNFVNNNTNVSCFCFDFDFDDFIDKNLSIHFVINFNEIVVDNEKINDKKIVNVDKIVDEM